MAYICKHEYKFGKKLRFSHTLYIRKMAQNGSLNCHKMAKNAPNELKFIPDMYFYEFYQIQVEFWEIF